jgi:hypothetical protein
MGMKMIIPTNTEHVFDDLAAVRHAPAAVAAGGKRDACDTASRRLALRRSAGVPPASVARFRFHRLRRMKMMRITLEQSSSVNQPCNVDGAAANLLAGRRGAAIVAPATPAFAGGH